VAEECENKTSTVLALPKATKTTSPKLFQVQILNNRGGVYIGWICDSLIPNKLSLPHLSGGIGEYEGTYALDSYSCSRGTKGEIYLFFGKHFGSLNYVLFL